MEKKNQAASLVCRHWLPSGRSGSTHLGGLHWNDRDQVAIAGERFKLKPNTITLVPERYGDIRYESNDDGYRDKNHAADDSRTRIVWLGDSVSFGLGVQQPEIFVSQVQKRIEEQFPQRHSVINLSIFAYNTANELDALREDGLKFAPKLVILQFYMNDFHIAPITATNATLGQRLTAVKNRLIYKSALYRRLHQLTTRVQYLLVHDYRRKYHPESLNKAEPTDKSQYLASHSSDDSVEAFQKIKEIAKLSRDQGAQFLLVVSPDETQMFTTEYDVINERIRQFCEREHYLYFDPLEKLRSSQERLSLYYDGVHFSPQGHALMGKMIFEDLLKKRLLEKLQ